MCARIGVDPLACKLSNIDFNYDEFSYSPLQLLKVSGHKCGALVSTINGNGTIVSLLVDSGNIYVNFKIESL